ncbi:hypothetical protein HU200_051823 [Digitaria exilis]|uniref:HNH nuclease domain-containing protein n=1 Tax=Digitaria exilis TaxID=1010633 RepID=A0A835E7J6_9POAL|nr:hypothetical protein HU200_051823 [Digitaria exilis]
MVITEEQRRRAEANRLAALEKRKRLAEAAAAAATASTSYNTTFPASGTPTFPTDDTAAEWRLAKCPRIAPPAPQSRFVSLPPRPSPPPPPQTPPQPPVGFKVVLEVCSPDEFLVAVGPAEGKAYPGEANCLGAVQDCLAAALVVQYSVQSQSQSCHLRPVFKLVDYDVVSKSLKKLPGAVVEEIPPNTMKIIQDIPMLPGQKWASDKEVDDLLKKLPQQVKDSLLPFQLEGVRFGLRRRGCCLIADEMGLGKTLQHAASRTRALLIVCPAVLRYTWADELERWDPSFMPKDIHLGDNRPFDIYHQIHMLWCVGTTLETAQRMEEWARLGVFDGASGHSLGIRRLKEHLLNELPPKRCQKTIIFAHHLKVLDGIQVKVAIIGITAGGVGLDFSSAQNVVFVELPKSASELLQAEDRAHGRGQTNAVNIYIFCGKNTSDESHWLQLNQSLFRVSSLMNGKKDAIREIEVDQVCHLEEIRNAEEKMQSKLHPLENHNAESDDMSMECFPGIEDLDFDSDFTIRTIPLEFEDEIPGTSLKINPTPTVAGDRSCVDVSLSPAAAFCTAISSCKSMKVSRHTGRIHLYSCVPGHYSRPKPLLENFLPEELNSPSCSSSDVKARTLLLKKIPAFCNVFKAFIKEWLALRPIDRSRLLGKPLQLPLSLELCFLKDSINHSTEALFQIERGKCSQCKLDCSKLVRHMKPLSMEKREEYIRKAAPNIANRKNLLDKLVREPIDGNAWHADHIIPVYKGGGECNLENMRTLCVACHYVVTRAQHKELKEIRKKAKEHLKNALNQQKDKASEATEEIDVSSLLVTVPGSAYSIGHEVTADANEIVAE